MAKSVSPTYPAGSKKNRPQPSPVSPVSQTAPISSTAAGSMAVSYWLSGALAVLTLIASTGSFFIPGLFSRDPLALGGCARGTALVMLVVALPTLVISMVLAARGSLRARITWLGATGYILYNSFYFAFSASFNSLFLVYVALLSLGLWSLVVLLIQMDRLDFGPGFAPRLPTKVIAISLLFPILQFSLMDLRESLTASLSGSVPLSIVGTQMPTNHFHILDLAVLSPLFILAAVWLWQRRPWGLILAGVMSYYYTVELLGVATDQWFGSRADPNAPQLASMSIVPVLAVLFVIYLTLLVIYLRKLRAQ